MINYQIVVIGAGAAGLVVSVGAAKAGKKVLLIEKGSYGGDCTNFGCIPSKSLIASANIASAIGEAKNYGLNFSKLKIETSGVFERIRKIIEEIKSHEDPAALKKIGVETLTGQAQFENSQILNVNGKKISAKNIVIATGSSPYIPPIKGLFGTPFHTNETIFTLKRVPESLIVIGGGPIGSELAQAFLRLGSQVTIIHSHSELLNKEDPQAQSLIAKCFRSEGMHLFLNASVTEISYLNAHFVIKLGNGHELKSEALLVATGRRPNVSSLNLEAAKIKYTKQGITVDKFGRTSQKHIYAVGDVVGKPFFTHWAESQARSVLTSLLLPFKKKLNNQAIPRVTFTDPEIASIGLSEKEAAMRYNSATYFVPFTQVDRAQTSGKAAGFIKIITKKWSSKILGCTIVGERAGEMINEISLAMFSKIPLRKLSGLIHPYPTYNLAIRKASDQWLTKTILAIFKRKK